MISFRSKATRNVLRFALERQMEGHALSCPINSSDATACPSNKKPQDSQGTLRLWILAGTACLLMLIFVNHYALNHALLGRASVIHFHLLTGAERGCYDSARAVYDPRGRSEREAHRACFAFDHDRLPRLISCYCPGRVSCGRFGCRYPCHRIRLRRLGGGCACLRKRPRRNQRAGESNYALFHSCSLRFDLPRSQSRARPLYEIRPFILRLASRYLYSSEIVPLSARFYSLTCVIDAELDCRSTW